MIQLLATRWTRMPGRALELSGEARRHGGDQVDLVVAEGGRPREGLRNGLVDDALDLRRSSPVAVKGLDDHPVVLDQLDEAVGTRAHRAQGHALVAFLGDVLGRNDGEVQEPVDRAARRAGA